TTHWQCCWRCVHESARIGTSGSTHPAYDRRTAPGPLHSFRILSPRAGVYGYCNSGMDCPRSSLPRLQTLSEWEAKQVTELFNSDIVPYGTQTLSPVWLHGC